MKKLIIFLAVIFFMTSSTAFCADVVLKWDAATGATSYKIYMSVNNGTSWTVVATVGNVLTTTVANVPNTGVVLFRKGSVNSQGEIVYTSAGSWFNGAWALPGYNNSLSIP